MPRFFQRPASWHYSAKAHFLSFFAAVFLLIIFPFFTQASAQEGAKPSRANSYSNSTNVKKSEAAETPAAAPGDVIQIPKINLGISPSGSPGDISTAIQIIILLTVLSLAPSILIMATAFTRIVVVMSFVRRALATQQLPSNQILIGLSLILTFFVMAPTFAKLNDEAFQPYLQRQVNQIEALQKTSEILKEFMLKQTQESDLSLFISLAHGKKYEKRADVPFHIVMPAFILSEMKIAFEMGIIIFLPFLVIDMVVASVLMSMGMMMLPPVMISLPFKLLVFVLADGWHLIIKSLVSSFA